MNTVMKAVATVCLSFAGYASASAATIFDFTDSATYSAVDTLTSFGPVIEDGIGLTLSAGPVAALGLDYDPAAFGTPVTFEGTALTNTGEGIGIGTSTNPALGNGQINNTEVLTLTFDQDVEISAIAFLNTFVNTTNTSASEQAFIEFYDAGGVFLSNLTVFGTLQFPQTNGFAQATGLGLAGVRSLQITAPTGVGDDVDGFNEVTLAALAINGVSAVPEPATWLMMIMGFGLVSAASRRRKQVMSLS